MTECVGGESGKSDLQRRVKDTRPFFSGDDMNMTAMSKRLTLARLLRTSSVTVGSSFLHKTNVNAQYDNTCNSAEQTTSPGLELFFYEHLSFRTHFI